MFQYNRFWHFWFTLDNRHYLRSVLAAITVALVASYFFFPLFLATYFSIFLTMVVPSLVIGGIFTVFNKLSDFFYTKQQTHLQSLKRTLSDTHPDPADQLFNEQIDYYLGRRVVCPTRLLAGQPLEVASGSKKPLFNVPPHFSHSNVKVNVSAIKPSDIPGLANRNKAYQATDDDGQSLFVKTAHAQHALSEVAAGEMAAISGLGDLIPTAALAPHQPSLSELHSVQTPVNSFSPLNSLFAQSQQDNPPKTFTLNGAELLPTTEQLGTLIQQANETRPEGIKYSVGVEKAMLKFISLMLEIRYKIQLRNNPDLQLLYIQEFLPNAQSGLQWVLEFMPTGRPGAPLQVSDLVNFRVPDSAKQLIKNIDIPSFQENFLLHLMLGSKDCNVGNTLFVTEQDEQGQDVVKLYSVDHEDIMPEDNYNITKQIPLIYDTAHPTPTPQNVENVFPMKIWLAGLPQADVPFTKEVMRKALQTLDPQRILAYHHHKKLFSPKAVGAQLDRVNLIREVFKAELAKPEPSLTPKALYLKFIDNHPSYAYLKKFLPDFSVYQLLGMVPSDSEMSMFLHPLQYIPMLKTQIKAVTRQQQGATKLFTDEEIATPYPARVALGGMAAMQMMFFRHCKQPIQVLEEMRSEITVGRPGGR